tara:strand:- start:775 stop:1224 length:450 start_codon:yes stop_codon:yes gene_type:complete
MKIRPLFYLLIISVCFLFIGCQINETVGLIDSLIEVTDKDSNKLNIQINGRYSTKKNELTKKETQYIKNEEDILKFISETVEKASSVHTASEIYNYKRTEIEAEVKSIFEDNYKNVELKVLDFNFVSVDMSDSLMTELVKRHKEKMNEQ